MRNIFVRIIVLLTVLSALAGCANSATNSQLNKRSALIATGLGENFVANPDWNVSTYFEGIELESVLPKMIDIKGGSFEMGDRIEEGDPNEWPVHQVTVEDFRLAETEVTFDLLDLWAAKTGQQTPKNDEGWGRKGFPAIYVSYETAQALIVWLNQQTGRKFRLPTEAEWEYAARAGSTDAFLSGMFMSRDYGNYGPADCCAKGYDGVYGADKWPFTAPVASFKPNSWGLYDTAGNVWEWMQDCYNENYHGAPTDGSAWNEGDCTRAPMRGGSWTHYSRNVRSANRNENLRSNAVNGYGVRLAEDAN